MGQQIGYVGLGSNLGDRRQAISRAIELLDQVEGTRVVAVSKIIETTPLPAGGQLAFLNAVAKIRTYLDAFELLRRFKQIEAGLGRVAGQRWGPRRIDLDLLMLGQQVIDSDHLCLPHPQMHLRWFVLRGLLELDQDLIHPVLRQPIKTLASWLNGKDYYIDPDAPRIVCMAGLIGSGKTSWASAISQRLSGQLIREPYDTNPFLPALYDGRRDLALDCQLYFLVHRSKQLAKDHLDLTRVYVADYLFQQEQIYAKVMLDPRQLDLYWQIYRRFSAIPARPTLVMYLQVNPKICLERIRRRARPYEKAVGMELLEVLEMSYQGLFADWDLCPVMRLDAEQMNPDNEEDVDSVSQQIRYYIHTPAGPKG